MIAMPKQLSIVRILIDEETFQPLCENQYLISVMTRVGEWRPRGSNIASSPIVTWSRQYDDLMHALHDCDVRHEVMNITDEYEFKATFAPADYDYTGFGTVHVCSLPTDDPRRTERMVAIPKERMEYQLGRYSSGMYGTRAV